MLVFRMLAGTCLALTVALAGAQDPKADMEKAIKIYNSGDLPTAMQWFRRAAEAGYSPAQVRLAYILDQAEENREALKWYRRAAEQGDAEGQLGLGLMYGLGEGTEPDPKAAIEWITKAAEQGLTRAMATLARNYEAGGLGFRPNQALALQWLQRAAAGGDHDSIRRLASAYRDGELGLPVDATRAAEWEAKVPKPTPRAKPTKRPSG